MSLLNRPYTYLIQFCFLLLFLSGLVSAQSNNTTQEELLLNNSDFPDSLSAERIVFALVLKKSIGEQYWKAFSQQLIEGPFLYFNKEKTEVFFPNQALLERIDYCKKHNENYLICDRTDTLPYHFELMISFDQSEKEKIYYQNAILQFLSVEETAEFIPTVQSTEIWTSMVIHEMFHQFQYNQAAFKNYAKNTISNLSFDTRDLNRLGDTDNDFLSAVQLENDYLINAIEANTKAEEELHINAYLMARKKRISKYKKDYPYLEQVENFYIIQEGSARYIEYRCMQVFNLLANNSKITLIENDPRFYQFQEFKIFDLESNDFNFLIYASPYTYHYAIGFNLLRLLDKQNIDYQEKIFEQPEIGLHQYLLSPKN